MTKEIIINAPEGAKNLLETKSKDFLRQENGQ